MLGSTENRISGSNPTLSTTQSHRTGVISERPEKADISAAWRLGIRSVAASRRTQPLIVGLRLRLHALRDNVEAKLAAEVKDPSGRALYQFVCVTELDSVMARGRRAEMR